MNDLEKTLRSFSKDFIILSNPDTFFQNIKMGGSGDIDLIWLGDSIQVFLKETLLLGFVLNVKFSSPHRYQLIAPYHDKIIHLDIVRELTIDQKYFVSKSWLSKANRQLNEFCFLNPTARAFLILSKIKWEKKSVTQYSDELLQISRECPQLTKVTWENVYEKILQDGTTSIYKVQKWYFLALDKFSWIANVFYLILKKMLPPPPFIAFVGLDGAGKSTTIEALLARSSFKINSYYWGSRKMVLPSTKMFRAIERRRTGFDIRKQASELKFTSSAKPVKRAFWKKCLLFIVFINKYLEYLAKYLVISLYRLKGVLVLNDRFVVDEYLEYKDPYFKINNLLYRYLFPTPQLLFVLVAEAKTIHQRRPDISEEVAQHLLSDYKNITHRNAKIIVLSSESSIELVCSIVWKEIFQVWRN